jgi:S-adenosylmethionine hydrolase
MKAKFLVIAATVGLGGMVAALADDVQFVTLPETVRTAVIRETRIPDVSRVTRVVRDENGLYEVTVRRESDNDVVYVDPYGRVIRQQTFALTQPVGVNRQQVVTETVTEETEVPTVDTFVRSLDTNRFQLIEKKGNKEVYVDRRTGKKWTVKVDSDD